MALHNRLEHVSFPAGDGRSLDAAVRVRGFAMRVPGFEVMLENREPEEIVVHGPQTVHRLAFPRADGRAMALALVAAPIISRVLVRLLAGRSD